MTLPLTLPISIKDLETEFSAPAGTPFSAFVRNGAYVPTNSDNLSIPTALPLKMTDFYGASATIPVVLTIAQDPANLVGVLHDMGVGACSTHTNTDPVVQANDKYVIDVTVKCNDAHIDGDQTSPQMAGYSWQQDRMSILFGSGSGWSDFFGVNVLLYFTSATTGYVRSSVISGASGATYDGAYNDKANTNYGNFVLPSDTEAVRIRVTRGESITQYDTGKYALDYNVYLYLRDEWVNVWKGWDIRMSNAPNPTFYNEGGTLYVGNNTYLNNAECDLDFLALDAAVGAFVVP